jgi:hypothetical protein
LPSPVVSVGDLVIDLVPPPVKDMAIRLFGTIDKIALLAGILLVILGYSAAIGVLAQRKGLRVGRVGIGLFGLLGAGAALAGQSGPIGVVPSLVGAGIGMLALEWLISSAMESGPRSADAGRRAFVLRAASATVVGLAGAASGRWLVGAGTPGSVAGPAGVADRPLPPLPPRTDLEIEGLTPFVTSNADFYRIDTALEIPRIQIPDFKLRVTGMVDRPLELTFEQLTARPLVEADITLTCVSNEVGESSPGMHAGWASVWTISWRKRESIRVPIRSSAARSTDTPAGFPCRRLMAATPWWRSV